MANRRGKSGSSDRFYFLGLQNHHGWWLQSQNYKTLAPWKKNYEKSRQHIKKNTHHFANKAPYGPHGQIYAVFFFSVLIYGCESWTLRLSIKELVPSNCGVGEDSWESLGQQRDQRGQSLRKSTLKIHWKNWSWSSNTLATWCKELIHCKRPWCWERSRAGGEEGDRGWDDWMASPTQWTWVWANSGR